MRPADRDLNVLQWSLKDPPQIDAVEGEGEGVPVSFLVAERPNEVSGVDPALRRELSQQVAQGAGEGNDLGRWQVVMQPIDDRQRRRDRCAQVGLQQKRRIELEGFGEVREDGAEAFPSGVLLLDVWSDAEDALFEAGDRRAALLEPCEGSAEASVYGVAERGRDHAGAVQGRVLQ